MVGVLADSAIETMRPLPTSLGFSGPKTPWDPAKPTALLCHTTISLVPVT